MVERFRKGWRGEEGLFAENARVKVGDGNKTSFWHDRWLRDVGILRHKYRRLFAMSTQQDCSIKEVGVTEGGGGLELEVNLEKNHV